MSRHDEVHLPHVRECELLKPGAVTNIVGGLLFEAEIGLTRIKEAQNLAIIDEDVDVVAFPVADLDHHGRAAAERPSKLMATRTFLNLIKEVTGNGEETRPV